MPPSAREKIETHFRRCKDKLEIVIYGSYEPEEELFRLETLRDHLISCGYTQAALVKDYPNDIVPPAITDPAQQVYVKSTHLCRISHCNFIVATHEGRGRGWINELTFCCRDCPDGIVKTAVFDEMRDTQSAVGVVNLGMISLHGMTRVPFRTSDDLKEAGERVALNYVVRLLDKLGT